MGSMLTYIEYMDPMGYIMSIDYLPIKDCEIP
jgi:hypothetical protein